MVSLGGETLMEEMHNFNEKCKDGKGPRSPVSVTDYDVNNKYLLDAVYVFVFHFAGCILRSLE